jgi:F-box and WD-40 domain protein CDC4
MQSEILTLKRQKDLDDWIESLSFTEIEFVMKRLVKKREKQRQNVTKMSDLAGEILIQIFSYLQDGKSFLSCSLVCKRWREILNDNFLWKQICTRKQYRPLQNALSRIPTLKRSNVHRIQKQVSLAPWKGVYMQNYLTWKNWMVGKCKVSNLSPDSSFLCMSFDEERGLSLRRGHPVKLVFPKKN